LITRPRRHPPPGFDQLKTKLFEPYCSRCHAFLLDAGNVKDKLKDIQADIATDKMPQGGPPLKPEIKKLLQDWVAAGMPAGFSEIKHKLFVPYCVRCHAGFSDPIKTAKRADAIQKEVEADNMPKGDPPLPAELKQLLSDWIKTGMAN
jgi:cytochrome c1